MTLKDNKLKLKSKDISNAQRDKHQAHSKPRQTPKMELFVKNSYQLSAVNYFCKISHFRCLAGF